MLERRKPKENIGAIKKTWLREKPWMSRGFYTWVTSEFHTWVTSVSGMWKVWFPQWEGSSMHRAINFHPQGGWGSFPSSWGCSRGRVTSPDPGCPEGHQPVLSSSTSGKAVRVRGTFLKAEIPDILHLGRGTKGQRRKACPWEDRNRSVFFLFLFLQDCLMKNTGLH